MNLKIAKITLPLKGDALKHKFITNNRVPDGIIVERRNPIVKSNLKAIKDYGKEFDIGRLLFTRIQQR